MMLLETEKLSRIYGGVVAVNEVDFRVQEGLITGLIGPNGAGKTTLFNKPDSIPRQRARSCSRVRT